MKRGEHCELTNQVILKLIPHRCIDRLIIRQHGTYKSKDRITTFRLLLFSFSGKGWAGSGLIIVWSTRPRVWSIRPGVCVGIDDRSSLHNNWISHVKYILCLRFFSSLKSETETETEATNLRYVKLSLVVVSYCSVELLNESLDGSRGSLYRLLL
jgi:hypothetical protein